MAIPVAWRISMARSGGVGVTGGVSAGTSETVSVSELVLAGLFLSSFWSAGRFWGSIRLVGTFIVVVLGLAEVAAGAALVSSPLVGLRDVAGAATPVVAAGTGVVLEEIEAGAAVLAFPLLVGLVASAAIPVVAVGTGVVGEVAGVDVVVHFSVGLVGFTSVLGLASEEVGTRMVVVSDSNSVDMVIVVVAGGNAVGVVLIEVAVGFEGMAVVCPPKARLDSSDLMVVTFSSPMVKLDELLKSELGWFAKSGSVGDVASGPSVSSSNKKSNAPLLLLASG